MGDTLQFYLPGALNHRWVQGSGNHNSICTNNPKVYDAMLGAFSSKTQVSMKEGARKVGGQKPAFSPLDLSIWKGQDIQSGCQPVFDQG